MRRKDHMSPEAYAEFRRKENARHKRWREANPEAYRELLKRYTSKPETREVKRRRRKQLYEENPESLRKVKANRRLWFVNNPESVKLFKIRYRLRHPEKVKLEKTKRRRQARVRAARTEMLAAGEAFVQDMQHA